MVSAFASEAGIVLGQVKTHEKSKESDYLLALKGNQSGLYENVRLHFEQPAPAWLARMMCAESVDKGHGRLDVRQCRMSTDIDWLRKRHPEWTHFNSIIAIDSERIIGETTIRETRHFISRSLISAEQTMAAV